MTARSREPPRPTTLEIDLDAAPGHIRAVRRMVGPGARVGGSDGLWPGAGSGSTAAGRRQGVAISSTGAPHAAPRGIPRPRIVNRQRRWRRVARGRRPSVARPRIPRSGPTIRRRARDVGGGGVRSISSVVGRGGLGRERGSHGGSSTRRILYRSCFDSRSRCPPCSWLTVPAPMAKRYLSGGPSELAPERQAARGPPITRTSCWSRRAPRPRTPAAWPPTGAPSSAAAGRAGRVQASSDTAEAGRRG